MNQSTGPDTPTSDGGDSSQQADATNSGVAIRLRDLHVLAGSRPLLTGVNADFPAGQVTLIAGCSGVGKSVLLKILANLMTSSPGAIEFSGSITRHRDNEPVADDATAVVFQNFALFDELSPAQNVEIAIDHSQRRRSNGVQSAKSLLDHLGVPQDRPTSVLSGGQQQRLAIARALAMETGVILYDEPTSGLDESTSERVVELIRSTHEQFGQTAIIVTHDFASLRKIADHVFVLNHRSQSLEEVPREQWSQLRDVIGSPPERDEELDRRRFAWFTRSWQAVLHFVGLTGLGLEQALALPWSLLPLWSSVRWGLRSTGHYLRLVAGPSACAYIVISGIIIGFVAQDFIFRYLPFRQYTEPLLMENLLHATGFSLYRFLVPILCTILIAARSGAAVAADVGSKVYGNQLDAMRTIGARPERLVRTPILYAFLVGTPFLTLLSYAAASLTAAVAFLATHADQGITFWNVHYHRELREPGQWYYDGTGWLIAKLLCCAVATALIAWNCGSTPKKSGQEISTGVTRTILWSTLLTLVVHFVFSLLEFKAPT